MSETVHARKTIVNLIWHQCQSRPDVPALLFPDADGPGAAHARLSYGELAQAVATCQAELQRVGCKPGDRWVLLMPASAELYIVLLALLSARVTAVFLDPGMERRQLLKALSVARVKGVLSTRKLNLKRKLLLAAKGVRVRSVRRGAGGGRKTVRLEGTSAIDVWQEPDVDPRGEALISFTSGTTGFPKGADRRHDVLYAQYEAHTEIKKASFGAVHMTCFPIIVILNMCFGATSVLPAIDLSRPGVVPDPDRVASQIESLNVSLLSGSPAFLSALVEGAARREALATLRAMVTGGAPISRRLCQRVGELLPDVEATVVMGSTEAEPISMITFRELLSLPPSRGYLVGRPAGGIRVRFDHADLPGEEGELLVAGPQVLRNYIANPDADRRSLWVEDGVWWRRTGDIGFLDDAGRIHLVGRKSDIVRVGDIVRHPFPLEIELEDVPGIRSAAVVQAQDEGRIGVFVCLDEAAGEEDCRSRVREILSRHQLPDPVIIRLDRMPLDARHNSKILRETLRARI